MGVPGSGISQRAADQEDILAGVLSPRAKMVTLGLVFACLVALELFPILVSLRYDLLWLLNSPEDFTWSFWPPLKTELRPSYFFFPTGMFYWTLLRPVHWVTEVLAHTRQATVAYMQLFGYAARIEFLILTLLLAGFVLLTTQLKWSGKLVVLLFMLYMIIGTVPFFQIYHMHVGLQLDYKLVQAAACVLLVIQLEHIFSERPGGQFPVLVGLLAGVLFFDMPLYSYLTLFLTGNILAMTTCREWALAFAKIAVSAAAAAAGLLYIFYRGDPASLEAAVYSQVSGVLRGFPQPQPGFQENFVDRALRPDSWYFAHQILLLGGGVLAIALIAWYLRTRPADRRPRFDATLLRLSALYLLALVVHLVVMRRHGSYTIVFSAAFLAGLYMLLILFTIARRGGVRQHPCLGVAGVGILSLFLVFIPVCNTSVLGVDPLRAPGSYPIVVLAVLLAGLYMLLILFTTARRGGLRHHRPFARSAAGILSLLLMFMPIYTSSVLATHPYGRYLDSVLPGGLDQARPQAAASSAVRRYDGFLHALGSEHTLYVNQDLYFSDCLVAWQYYFAEEWTHISSGYGGYTIDARYAGLFQRVRYPGWYVYFPRVIGKVAYRWGKFQVQEGANPLTRVGTTAVIALNEPLGRVLARAHQEQVVWVDYERVLGHARETLVDGYPYTALYEMNPPWAPADRAWSVIPLAPEEATGDAVTLGYPQAAAAMRAGYLPFMGSLCGSYHLLLVKAQPGSATRALAAVIVTRERAREQSYWTEAHGLAEAVRAYHAAHGCYPSWTGAGMMPPGLAPYAKGPWPAGYHYLSLDRSMRGTGSRSTGYYVGVAALGLGLASEFRETVWVVHDAPAPIC